MRYLLILLCVPFLYINSTSGQDKRQMTPDVYTEWNRIRSVQLSNDGEWAKYHLTKQTGDATLKIYNTISGNTYTFDRVGNSKIDFVGDHVIFTAKPAYEDVRNLKRKKTDDDELPKDTLCIYNLENRMLTKIPNVKSFRTPVKWGHYVAYQKFPEESQDTLGKMPKETKKSGTKLVIQNLDNMESDTLLYSKEFRFADEGEGLVATTNGIDSLMDAGLYSYDFKAQSWSNILNTKGDIYNLSWQKDGAQLAFTVDQDTTETRIRPYELYHWDRAMKVAALVADSSSGFLPKGYNISNHTAPVFSENGERLFFNITPPPVLQDTLLLDDEIVHVEVWNYLDDRLYTRQENRLKEDQKMDFGCLYKIGSKSFSIIQNSSLNNVIYDEKRESDYAIGIESKKYDKTLMWLGHGHFDAYRINLETGQKDEMCTKERGRLSLSPSGNYAVFYNATDKAHYAYNVLSNKRKKITSTKIGVFYDEKNDRPMDPYPYGDAGFTSDEEFILMYDRFDIWLIDPDGKDKAKKITNGRQSKHVYRLIDTDDEEKTININKPLLLHRFNEKDKSEAYVSLDLDTGVETVLYTANVRLDRTPIKAKEDNRIITTIESYSQFPDLVMTDTSFETMKTISNANPQQTEYNWGTIELHSWKSLAGLDLQGLLVLPDGFDPKKKYPLIVNFYERSSDGLHRHRAPFAHRSTISYSYYSSKGYIIFNPDIIYRNGYPGQSCYDAVMPGIKSLIDKGYIDEDRIGVQGHSWGGYQIADLLTKTDIFKCAESGAPVVNMISAYGGIRWGSGMSRMFQYEKTQSRLGATLWENPKLYLENSPIFYLDKVTTPVLILHNDEDGAVPWYQGIEYFNGLRRLAKPAWLLNYNGEPHWPVKWQNKLDFNIRMEQFFDHYLKDQPMPRWMRRGVPATEKGILQGLELDRQ